MMDEKSVAIGGRSDTGQNVERLTAQERVILDLFRACNGGGREIIITCASRVAMHPDFKNGRTVTIGGIKYVDFQHQTKKRGQRS